MKESINNHSKPTTTILPLAVVVGWFTFAITETSPGGLSGVAGFFIGIATVVFLYVGIRTLLIFIDNHAIKSSLQSNGESKNILVIPSKKENSLTIHIQFDSLAKTIHLSVPGKMSETISIASSND